jgi:hypothetical protein
MMTEAEIANCTDDELVRILQAFGGVRERVLTEMGRRVADRVMLEQAMERARRTGCAVQHDFLNR